ncbi:MAG: InlB B-repeat-containing protein, partial [Oscillospiraceae bacterium]|nr:InlB B-repeat-containing protein [Oscillospiraceae bacterium]
MAAQPPDTLHPNKFAKKGRIDCMKIFKTLSKRGLALFLVLTMCVSLLPATALAAEAAEALHTHNEDGWACVEESQLICGYEQEHTHDETCWAASEKTLACSLEEAEGHQHDESCYTEETTLACGQEESEEHSHDETCYVTETVLSCGQEEAEGHAHGEDCFAAGEAVLTCELEEHQHGEACYASVWTCTEPSEDVSRFLRAVKAIPEDITAENVEEAEVRIAEAIEAYQHLGGAEKSNASVVRAYDVILAAEIAVEAAKNGAPEETPETVLPEDAVVIDPAVLVEYTGIEEEEVAVADLFTFVANTYLANEEDPDVVTLPASLYFVGENVEERFDIMDILFPAESEDELPEEPETVALTSDSIVYQDVPVTAYFLPEEAVAQEELLMEMGNDEVELLLEKSYSVAVGEDLPLKGSTGTQSKDHTWTQSGKGEGEVIFAGGSDKQNVTITGLKPGTVILTHTYSYYNFWSGNRETTTESTTVTVLAPEANEIRFDLNGGRGAKPNAIPFEDTQTPVTLPSGDGITQTDHKLLGWALYPDVSLIHDGESAPQGVIYELGDETFVPSQDGIITLYAVWGQVTGCQSGNIKMAIRADNTIPTEPSIQTASYSYFTNLTNVNILDYFSPAHTVAGVEKVDLCLTDEFHQYISGDTQSAGYQVSLAQDKVIDWYVIKHQENDGYWHIDGVVRDKEKVSLTYDGNGDTGGLAPDGRNDYTAGDKATVANQGTLVKTGYEFDGWNTAADGSGEAYQVNDQIQLNENVILYAQWRQKGYEVQYDLAGGKLNNQTSIRPKGGVKWEQSGLTPSGTPEKEGYQFDGWYLKDTDTAVTTQKYYELVDSDTVMTVTLVAKWTAKDAQIVFNANGGTDAPEGITGTTGESITATFPAEAPVRVGYEFTGWYTETVGGKKVEAYPATFPADTTTYYAHWNLRNDLSYTVQYLDQNGKEIIGPETVSGVAYDSIVTEEDVEARKLIKDIPGYTFENFQPEEGLKIDAPSERNVVKLIYKAIEYTVKYLPGDHGTFQAAEHTKLHYNDNTPAAPASVTGEDGWRFTGWAPERAEKVTASVEYVAQWEQIEYTVKYLPGDHGTFQAAEHTKLHY